MATLSLREISQSQLSQTPIIPGQLICCTDTGNFYKDNTENSRISLGSSVIYVNSLPLAPLSEKIYLLKPDKLYLYDGDWIELNKKQEMVITKDTIYDFPPIGDKNCIYISKATNKTYRWSNEDTKYFCVGSDYDDINIINGGNSSSE